MTWRQRVRPPKLDDLPPVRVPQEPALTPFVPRRCPDLERALGHDSARRVVEAAATLRREPMPEEPASSNKPGAPRDGYFHPGGYAAREDPLSESRYLDWRRAVTGRSPDPWELNSPDPNVRLDLWVQRQLANAGLPACLCSVVERMALVTMRDGVEAARRVLLEERAVPEEYHFAIDGILKQIPPLT